MQINKELEEAAFVGGAGVIYTIRRVTIPLMLPSLVAGVLFIFLLSAKVASMAILLYTTDTIILPVWIWLLWQEGTMGETAALSVLMILGLTTIIILGRTLIQQRAHIAE